MSRSTFQTAFGRTNLFLVVRTHSQMQYYFNLSNTRRAANDSAVAPPGGRVLRNFIRRVPS
jgi:hypothetical protein